MCYAFTREKEIERKKRRERDRERNFLYTAFQWTFIWPRNGALSRGAECPLIRYFAGVCSLFGSRRQAPDFKGEKACARSRSVPTLFPSVCLQLRKNKRRDENEQLCRCIAIGLPLKRDIKRELLPRSLFSNPYI